MQVTLNQRCHDDFECIVSVPLAVLHDCLRSFNVQLLRSPILTQKLRVFLVLLAKVFEYWVQWCPVKQYNLLLVNILNLSKLPLFE